MGPVTSGGEDQRASGLIGHSGAISLLDRSLQSGRLSHAYLLVGPRHVGKMALALYLAKAVNCRSEGDRPCDSCPQCRRIASGQHADVQVIGVPPGEEGGPGTTRIKIERMRELQRQASFHPYEGTCRVYIIDGAELLSHEAANCLLKTLEEPPPEVLLLLLTAKEAFVLPTILSRCQRIELRPMPVQELARDLAHQLSVEGEKAGLLARLSGGCPGWAISAVRDEGVLEGRLNTLERLMGVIEAGLEGRFSYASELGTLFTKNRRAGQEVLDQWLSWWGDLLLIRAGVGDSVTNAHRRRELEQQAQRYPLSAILAFIRSLGEAQSQLEQNASPRLVLEVLMLKLPAASELRPNRPDET
ncbi:MAG: DNA polymerase III subunit delta' [Dehalococcoidia bacterium]